MLHIETPLAAGPAPSTRADAARAGSNDNLAPIHQPFPQLIGVEITEASPTRVRARLKVRADLCRSGHMMHGGATMAFRMSSCIAWPGQISSGSAIIGSPISEHDQRERAGIEARAISRDRCEHGRIDLLQGLGTGAGVFERAELSSPKRQAMRRRRPAKPAA